MSDIQQPIQQKQNPIMPTPFDTAKALLDGKQPENPLHPKIVMPEHPSMFQQPKQEYETNVSTNIINMAQKVYDTQNAQMMQKQNQQNNDINQVTKDLQLDNGWGGKR